MGKNPQSRYTKTGWIFKSKSIRGSRAEITGFCANAKSELSFPFSLSVLLSKPFFFSKSMEIRGGEKKKQGTLDFAPVLDDEN